MVSSEKFLRNNRGTSIAIAVQSFPVLSETFIVTKVLGLLSHGFDIQVFAVTDSDQWRQFKILDGREDLRKRVHVSVFRHSRNPFKFAFASLWLCLQTIVTRPVAFFGLSFHAYRVSRRSKLRFGSHLLYCLPYIGRSIDVIHAEFDAQAYGVADLSDYLDCKLVLSGRGAIGRTSVVEQFPDFYTHIFSRVDHYHFISRYLWRSAIGAGLKPDIPVSLIEPAIDLSSFKPGRREKKPNDKIILISVGRLSWAKGYEFAIDAVAIVLKEFENLEYWIIGDGPYRDAIQFAADQHNLVERDVLHFKGAVQRETVIEYLQRADLMIHSALEEGFCNAVIEAQAMELPVVTSDAGGLPENVENGVTGYVVARRDAVSMAEKIILLLRNDEMRLKMGKEGRRRVLSKFDLKDQIEKFTQMYQSV